MSTSPGTVPSGPGAGAQPVNPFGMNVLEIIGLSLWGAMVVGYFWWYIQGLRKDRRGFTPLRMLNTAPSWVGKVIRMPGSEQTAVQTLRNVILSLSFIATLAFTTGTSVVNEIVPQRGTTLTVEDIRKLLLAAMLYLAFLNFAISLRSASHVSMLLSAAIGQIDPDRMIKAKERPEAVTTQEQAQETNQQGMDAQPRLVRIASGGSLWPPPESVEGEGPGEPTAQVPVTPHAESRTVDLRVAKPTNMGEAAHLARRSQIMVTLMYIHFSLGFRCFYIAIPIALWRAGPIPFIVSNVIMAAFLLLVDSEVALFP